MLNYKTVKCCEIYHMPSGYSYSYSFQFQSQTLNRILQFPFASYITSKSLNENSKWRNFNGVVQPFYEIQK